MPAARPTPSNGRPPTGWRGQFACPTGPLGWIAGQLMALGNEPMNRLAAELLDVQPTDRVLEIGFGPGKLIQRLARRATEGFVAGVDPSAVMVRQATRRNRPFIQQGRVALYQGAVSRLPFPDRQFTKVCAVNSFQFWPRPEDDLREVRRVLQDDGLLLLCLRQHDPTARIQLVPGFTVQEIEAIQELTRRAGFQDVQAKARRAGRQLVAVVMARR
jgi:ubiquinone/menaquinone biosynthesis C-methylase UbiE